jgi:hypothetical protein
MPCVLGWRGTVCSAVLSAKRNEPLTQGDTFHLHMLLKPMVCWVAGGTFALYSLLKRQAEEGKARSDRKLSQYTMGPKKTRTWLQDGGTPGMLSRSRGGFRDDGTPREVDGDAPDWKQRFVQVTLVCSSSLIFSCSIFNLTRGRGTVMGVTMFGNNGHVVQKQARLQKCRTPHDELSQTYVSVCHHSSCYCLYAVSSGTPCEAEGDVPDWKQRFVHVTHVCSSSFLSSSFILN